LSEIVRWGMIGCGDVAEVKSGPGFQKARGSSLAAVMRRDRAKAEDFARRHGVPRAYGDAGVLIADPDVDAVYIATPPSSHRALALQVAAAGKPCLVEKPMATTHAECVEMIEAFGERRTPLWVAYYRRALPRFLLVRDLLRSGDIGHLSSVHITVREPLAEGAAANQWRVNPSVAGGGFFLDLASHCLDLVDFLVGPISAAKGYAINSAGAYAAEDVTAAAFEIGQDVVGTGIWNFNAAGKTDSIVFTGSRGELRMPVFTDGDVVVITGAGEQVHPVRNPPHVHQPLIQTIVDELRGEGHCESTGVSAARTSWVMDRCLEGFRLRGQVASR
jgi:1,5-anhydro-D-fructose reductase (1,5-anhydro-D-mannitol-forming)